jgi:hypothetical protein
MHNVRKSGLDKSPEKEYNGRYSENQRDFAEKQKYKKIMK